MAERIVHRLCIICDGSGNLKIIADKKPESYEAIADYWDAHELSDDNSEPCEIEVQIDQQKIEEESATR